MYNNKLYITFILVILDYMTEKITSLWLSESKQIYCQFLIYKAVQIIMSTYAIFSVIIIMNE